MLHKVETVFFEFFSITRQAERQRLGAELTEQCDPSSDPVFCRHVGVERHGDDIIGGVASGGQGAAPLAGLIDRRHVTHPLGKVLSFDRLQPHLTEREETEALEGAIRSNDKIRNFKLWLPHSVFLPPLATSANSRCHLEAIFHSETFDWWIYGPL